MKELVDEVHRLARRFELEHGGLAPNAVYLPADLVTQVCAPACWINADPQRVTHFLGYRIVEREGAIGVGTL